MSLVVYFLIHAGLLVHRSFATCCRDPTCALETSAKLEVSKTPSLVCSEIEECKVNEPCVGRDCGKLLLFLDHFRLPQVIQTGCLKRAQCIPRPQRVSARHADVDAVQSFSWFASQASAEWRKQ